MIRSCFCSKPRANNARHGRWSGWGETYLLGGIVWRSGFNEHGVVGYTASSDSCRPPVCHMSPLSKQRAMCNGGCLCFVPPTVSICIIIYWETVKQTQRCPISAACSFDRMLLWSAVCCPMLWPHPNRLEYESYVQVVCLWFGFAVFVLVHENNVHTFMCKLCAAWGDDVEYRQRAELTTWGITSRVQIQCTDLRIW